MCNRQAGPNREVDIHAEFALPAGGDNIFKVRKTVVNTKNYMIYILGSLIDRNDKASWLICIYI